jgi:beta-lactamase class D
MKTRPLLLLVILSAIAWGNLAHAEWAEEKMREVFGQTNGAFILRDCATGAELVLGEAQGDVGFAPCSTFKIWSSLIGLEEAIIQGPDEPFWKWDGVERNLPGWNEDRTWREAFAVSCVPAFQSLVRKIGPERMQDWLGQLGYGTRDQCGRPDAFWLPRAGAPTILITPREQARLLCALVNGQLPVQSRSVTKLFEVMKLADGPYGVLYGKTGSGLRASPDGPASGVDFDLGWLVGVVERNSKKYAYACLVLGPGLSSKDARKLTDAILAAAWDSSPN